MSTACLDRDEMLARMDANYFRSWSLLMSGTPGHEIVEQDGLMMTASGSTATAFNLAYLWPSARPLDERLKEVRAYFLRRRRRHLVRLREGAVPSADEALRAAGYARVDGEAVPAMVMVPACMPPPEDCLEVTCCRTGGDLEAWATTLAAGYGIAESLAASFTAPVRAGRLDYELYLGRVDGKPVATSGLALSHGVAGVYVVSTLPAERRRGHGAAMTWHAIGRGMALGARFASLQSSAMGLALYERMGFRTVGEYVSYEPGPGAR
jgi:ribosomal protein S18 acetylase RimI-like enzyme